jgi:HTH-type transcriptional regulator / antitoxin HigA
MPNIKAIRTEADHQAALERVDELMGAEADTPQGDELDVLVDLVEHYEEKHVPIGFPTPVEAIEFRMEQQGLTPRDLVPYIGSRPKVSEVLSGKRPLTMRMARALHEHLGIPADVLLRQGDEPEAERLKASDWSRFPIREIVKAGWLPKAGRSARGIGAAMADLVRRAGCLGAELAPLYRKNDHARSNAKSDVFALQAWCWQVLAVARKTRRPKYSREPLRWLSFATLCG